MHIFTCALLGLELGAHGSGGGSIISATLNLEELFHDLDISRI